MKKITQKEFENSLQEFKKIKLDDKTKENMKSKIMLSSTFEHANKSPYFSIFHFSYQKMFVSAFTLVFLISIGTTQISKYSLPGDLLYPIKTTIREPLIKLTKVTQKEKANFDLVLADTRIKELEELIVKNKTTEKNIEENSVLFDKHIEDSKEDESENISTSENDGNDIETELKIETELDNIEEELELNSRVEKYNDLIISVYDINIK